MNLKMNEVNFTGHVLTNKGLKRDLAKVEAITKMPKPQDIEGASTDSSSAQDQAFADRRRLVTEAPYSVMRARVALAQ